MTINLTRGWNLYLATQGRCWRFRFGRQDYFGGKVTYFTFWRIGLVRDRTL